MKIGDNCEKIEFDENGDDDVDNVYYITRDNLIDQGVIFFGAYAISLYSKFMSPSKKENLQKASNFDVIFENPERCALILKEQLERENIKKIKTITHEAIGELIPEHVEVLIDDKPLVMIYKPIACHNYNKIVHGYREINIASIDTILSFYLAFLYYNIPEHIKNRLSCMAKFVFQIQQKNRIEQRGILKRFSIDCYGKQPTLDTIRSEKAEKYKELGQNRNSRDYEMWFLKYIPDKIHHRNEYSKMVSKKFKKVVKIIDESVKQQEKDKNEEEKARILIPETKMKSVLASHKRRKTMKKTRVQQKIQSKIQPKISNYMERFRAKRKNQTQKLD
jgi:hypothetical protein